MDRYISTEGLTVKFILAAMREHGALTLRQLHYMLIAKLDASEKKNGTNR